MHSLIKTNFFLGNTHIRKSIFDYEKDGFGEDVYELDALADLIISYMENGCRVNNMYKECMENFFAYNDCNNFQRVSETITELCLGGK